jgi:hypothetical protein
MRVRATAGQAIPGGHVWEVAYNPGFALDRDGAIAVADFGGS